MARFKGPLMLVATLAQFALRTGLAADLPPMDCVIEPSQVIDVSSAVRGVIETVLVDRGDIVQEGQIVARLDSSVEQAALAYARARAAATSQLRSDEAAAAYAERHKNRIATAYGHEWVSQDQMDDSATGAQVKSLQLQQAREERRLAELEARQADEVVKRHVIRSPIQGVVVQRFLAPGESVVDKPIMRLAQINPLQAEIIVPVAYFGAVQTGQRAVVVPEAPKVGQYAGTVTAVDRVVDPASGTFRARVTLPNASFELPSGLRCTAKMLQPGETVAQKEIPPPPAARPRAEGGALSSFTPSSAAAPTSQVRTPAAAPPTLTPSANPTAKSAVAADPAAGRLCEVFGPISNESLAQKLRDALTATGGRTALRTEPPNRQPHYAVLAPQPESAEQARALVEKLHSSGIMDAVIVKRGEHAGSVSVGIYAGPRLASQRRDAVNAAGFSFEVFPLADAKPKYWLDAEAPRGAAALARYRQAIDAAGSAVPAKATTCTTATVARN